MNWSKALRLGFGTTFAGLVFILLITFVYDLTLDVPLFFTVTSVADPTPRTSLFFNPLGVLTVALLVSLLFRYAPKLASRAKKHGDRAP